MIFWFGNNKNEEKEEKHEISTKDIFNAIAQLPSEKQKSLELMGYKLPSYDSSQGLDEQAVQYQAAANEWSKACDNENLNPYSKLILLEMRVLYFHRIASGFLKNHIRNKHGLSQTLDLITYEKYLLSEAAVIKLCYTLSPNEIFSRIEYITEMTSIGKEHFEASTIGKTLLRVAISSTHLSHPPILLQVFYALAAENLRHAIDQSCSSIKELFALYRKAAEKSWELVVQLKDESRKSINAIDLSYYDQIEKSAGDEMEFLSIRLVQQADEGQSVRGIKNIDNIEAVTPRSTLRRVNKFRHKP